MPVLLSLLRDFWPVVLLLLNIAAAVLASGHAILYKRDPRSAVSWVGLIWLTPLVGALLYVSFGINRLERRAASLRRRRRRIEVLSPGLECTDEELREALGPRDLHLAPIARVARSLLGRPLLEGNAIVPLRNGEEAYPAMRAAIDGAQRSVTLVTYIFELDEVGRSFLDALARAVERGVQVRVLIDAVGSGKGRGKILRAFRERKVSIDVFLPLRVPWRTRYMNLRNHRKILVVDGRTGFTGGMNLRESHLIEGRPGHRERDLQFRLEGPVVEHLQEAFVDDWAFTTGEALLGEVWFPPQKAAGRISARGVPFDPGLKLDTFRSLLVAAAGAAERSIRIVTPYFLPESSLIAALTVAAMRGVEVDILIPSRGDHRLVSWATQASLWQVLVSGCRVWRTPDPFEHTKLMVVDGAWTFFGSMNVDTRSLRLNYEFNVEAYDAELGARMEGVVLAMREASRRTSLKEANGRSLAVRLRDGIARLFSPYL
jgi:cardiolipin synthase A/B